jgi:hypothetical protein
LPQKWPLGETRVSLDLLVVVAMRPNWTNLQACHRRMGRWIIWVNMLNTRRVAFVRRYTKPSGTSTAFGAGPPNIFAPPARNPPRDGRKISIRERPLSGGLGPNKHAPNG